MRFLNMTIQRNKYGTTTRKEAEIPYCLLCKSDTINDLTKGKGEIRNYYCPNCRAHFYKGKWWTWQDWDRYVEEVN
jgi:hypothetical protein